MDEELQTRRQHCRRAAACGRTEPAPAGPPRGQHQHETGGDPVQPRPPLPHATNRVARAHQPIGQDRFVETVIAVEGRHDPVVTRDHLHGRLGEPRLIPVDEWQRARARQQHRQRQKPEGHGRQPALMRPKVGARRRVARQSGGRRRNRGFARVQHSAGISGRTDGIMGLAASSDRRRRLRGDCGNVG